MRARLIPRYLRILLHRLRYSVVTRPSTLLYQLLRRSICDVRLRQQWSFLAQLGGDAGQGVFGGIYGDSIFELEFVSLDRCRLRRLCE